MERDSGDVEPGQRDGWSHLVFEFPLFGLEPDRRRLSRPGPIKGLVRRDAMGFGLWDLGAARDCRDAHTANPSAHLHRDVAVTDFRSLFRALSRKTAEIRRLRLACCRVPILVSPLRAYGMPSMSMAPAKGASSRPQMEVSVMIFAPPAHWPADAIPGGLRSIEAGENAGPGNI
jgi:hypothetical protein